MMNGLPPQTRVKGVGRHNNIICLTHDNPEVERSKLENSNLSKVLTSERSLLSNDSINAIRLTKDAI